MICKTFLKFSNPSWFWVYEISSTWKAIFRSLSFQIFHLLSNGLTLIRKSISLIFTLGTTKWRRYLLSLSCSKTRLFPQTPLRNSYICMYYIYVFIYISGIHIYMFLNAYTSLKRNKIVNKINYNKSIIA